MVKLGISFLVQFLQVHTVTVSRKHITEQLTKYFAFNCLLQNPDIGYIEHYDAVCKLPNFIPKGRLLSVTGLKEGSKAEFICDDFHFTNISNGVCRVNGTWAGLDSPCVHMASPPYRLYVVGKMSPGRCAAILVTPPLGVQRAGINLFPKTTNTTLLHVSFRFRLKKMVRNTITNGRWGREEKRITSWPLKQGQEANVTICTENYFYRCFVDGKDMFIFRHRFPEFPEFIQIEEMSLRRVEFMEGRRK